jgi:hypothetical protein
MKHKILFLSMVLSVLLSCKNQGNREIESGVIDIEHGIENLNRLKTSDFGKTVRYIPLETTDDGLVGRDPIVKVLRKHIVIEAQGSCLLFDKNDGRFIAKIGHLGQDPEAYSNIFSWADEKEEFLYFQRQPNQLMKYDMQGNFGGKVTFPFPTTLASYYLLSDSEVVGYFGGMDLISNTVPFSLGFFDRDGVLTDTIPRLFSETTLTPDEIVRVDVVRAGRSSIYGNWGQAGVMSLGFKNDSRQVIAGNAARIWKHNGNIRYKEEFVDTLYTVSDRKLVPSIVFNTGKYHWPVQERWSKKNASERIFIADISENESFIFFQCIKGMYANESVLYNGLYNKNTGKTKLDQLSDGVEDDLTHFMPFIPVGISTSGEFVSILEAFKIMDWIEEHPESKNNEKLSFLKHLDTEQNPVIVLIE